MLTICVIRFLYLPGVCSAVSEIWSVCADRRLGREEIANAIKVATELTCTVLVPSFQMRAIRQSISCRSSDLSAPVLKIATVHCSFHYLHYLCCHFFFFYSFNRLRQGALKAITDVSNECSSAVRNANTCFAAAHLFRFLYVVLTQIGGSSCAGLVPRSCQITFALTFPLFPSFAFP